MSLREKAGDRLPLIHRTLHLHLKLRRWSRKIVQILGQLKETAPALGEPEAVMELADTVPGEVFNCDRDR
jgi:hypothetical protein